MRRAYHFVSLHHGLDNLRRRRLKLSLLDDLNDPFELWAITQSDRRLRQTFRATKEIMAKECGLLCFSLDWHNPLLWSHYADRHRGLALGFDVDEQILKSVVYRKTRPALKAINMQVANWLLFTKYQDWGYEQEARVFTSLKDRDPASGLYFADFGAQLALREVIAGPLCPVTQAQLSEASCSIEGIEFRKARLAFNSFRVVGDQRGFR